VFTEHKIFNGRDVNSIHELASDSRKFSLCPDHGHVNSILCVDISSNISAIVSP